MELIVLTQAEQKELKSLEVTIERLSARTVTPRAWFNRRIYDDLWSYEASRTVPSAMAPDGIKHRRSAGGGAGMSGTQSDRLHGLHDQACAIIGEILHAASAETIHELIKRFIDLDRTVCGEFGGEPLDVWGMLRENRGCMADPIRRHCHELGVV